MKRLIASIVLICSASTVAFAQPPSKPAGSLFGDGFTLSFVYQKQPGRVVMRLSKPSGQTFENWECDLELSVFEPSGLATIRPAFDAPCWQFIVSKP